MTIYHGEVFGSTDPAQMPAVSYNWAYVKANSLNGGSVYLGASSDIALPGTTDATKFNGYELDAGQEVHFPTAGNLNHLWYLTDGSTDSLLYFASL